MLRASCLLDCDHGRSDLASESLCDGIALDFEYLDGCRLSIDAKEGLKIALALAHDQVRFIECF